jgi:hypothetical protein
MALNVSITELQPFMHPCPDLESTWLRVHFYYTCIVSIYLGMVILPVSGAFTAIWLLCRCCPHPEETLMLYEEGILEDINRRNRLIFLKTETKIVVIYLLLASVCTWVFDIGPINSMRLTRWIIEAFFFPWIVSVTIMVDYFDLVMGGSGHRNPSLITPGLFLFKFSQLVAMRYAELFPSSRLNDLQTLLFYHFCAAPGVHRIPADHPMKPFLSRLKPFI